MAKAAATSIEAQTRAELRTLAKTATVEGRLALRLAQMLDQMRSARDAAPVARELRSVLEVLREQSVEEAADPLDDLAAARARRRGTA